MSSTPPSSPVVSDKGEHLVTTIVKDIRAQAAQAALAREVNKHVQTRKHADRVVLWFKIVVCLMAAAIVGMQIKIWTSNGQPPADSGRRPLLYLSNEYSGEIVVRNDMEGTVTKMKPQSTVVLYVIPEPSFESDNVFRCLLECNGKKDMIKIPYKQDGRDVRVRIDSACRARTIIN